MQKKKTFPCLLAALSAVFLSALRVVTMPRIVDAQGGIWNLALFVLSLLTVVLLLLLSNRRPATMALKSGASLFSIGSVFTGAALLISSVSTYVTWRYGGKWPYPADKTPTQISELFVNGAIVFGLLSGAFFVLFGILLYRGKRLKGALAALSLAPLVWIWMRVCQYEVSYYSSLRVFRHWYDLLLLLVEMLFFLNLARYLLRVGKPPRLLLGLSLGTGVVAVMACVTRVAMVLTRNAEAFAACGLINAADLGVALLAFGFAGAYRPAEEGEEEQEDEQEELPPVEVEQEEDYLVSGITLTEIEDEDEEEFSDIHDQRKPIELEDILQSILSDIGNEEK